MMNDDNPFYRSFMALDSWLSSAGFEVVDFIQRSWSAYASWLERFRIRGLTRIAIDLTDDALTLGMGVAVIVAVVAIPPFNDTGDIWNKGRAICRHLHRPEWRDHRPARHPAGRRHPARGNPAACDQCGAGHRGCPLLPAFRRRHHRHAPRHASKTPGPMMSCRAARRSPSRSPRTCSYRRSARSSARSTKRSWRCGSKARLTKDEILKLYLDRSYLGGGNYGVEAAAQYYFGKSIRDVNLSEAAMLAGLFKAPSKYAPHVNAEAAQARANVVLYRMLDVGFITPGRTVRGQARAGRGGRNSRPITAPTGSSTRPTRKRSRSSTSRASPAIMSSRSRPRSIVGCSRPRSRSSTRRSISRRRPINATQAALGHHGRRTARSRRSSADATTRTASSTAPPMRCASPARRSSPSSIWRRCSTASRRNTIVVDGPVWVGGWSPKNYTGKYAGRTTLTNALAHSYNSRAGAADDEDRPQGDHRDRPCMSASSRA